MKASRFLFLMLAAGPYWVDAESLPGLDVTRVAVSTSTNACWWAGIIEHGFRMPLADGYQADMCGDTYGNQSQPLLLSSQGDVIWSDDAFAIQLSQSSLTVETRGGRLRQAKCGDSLRDAFLYASRTYFPPSGRIPDELLFLAPQYNTWIELKYDQNQTDILKYATGIQDNGFPPGVLMIDDNWQQNYGQWEFKRDKFPDPKAMIDHLHQRGFKVMLWICPFVNTNCEVYQELARRNLLLKEPSGAVASIKWWNGESALLDFTNPEAAAWFRSRLDHLQSTYQVDGFKFDGGDSSFYKGAMASKSVPPNTQSELYGKIGLQYPLNEYRAMWKMGGQPLAERLRDKDHSWSDLRKLVPNMLLEGLMGYPFSCPDMIGGGEYKSFQTGSTLDQELVVRSAQCHALMPMMQFSVAPWRVLDKSHLEAVLKAVRVREKHKNYILGLVRESALTGEPAVRSMEYVFPHQWYERVNDQFMLGDRILVAPVLERGACHRDVILPIGAWKGFDGKRYAGPARVSIPVAYDELCYFEKMH
ncbi:MAG TPA: glycoside hydrolase family 31 protein [Candidatus Binatia bacterium]|jgi:alpha-glucosidase (family GH31 glycosyl hydrolase)|nr:glycoside hydrolase family 31 protein [Candidatus Binatia bacterium]